MLVATPFHPGDADQALRMFRWISELEGGRQLPHDLLLVADARCAHGEIEAAARECFQSVETLSFIDHYRKWPEAPNAAFAAAARHIMAHQRVPWLFLEPDCCPLKAGWLDAIEAEYKAAGKPFMGARVDVNQVPLHMSGNAVYPVDLFAHAGLLLNALDIAFDVAAASQIVPQAHFTKLIEHSWKRDGVTKENLPFTFATWDQVEREVSKEAVVYHASKDGSLIERLRERKNNLPVPVLADTRGCDPACEWLASAVEARESTITQTKPQTGTGDLDARGGQFICDILIKSFPRDFERVGYCLRSIEKFARGFRKVIVIIPKGEYLPVDHFLGVPHTVQVEVIEVEEHGEPYLFQQTVKASAHTLTDADFVLHLDSDCLLTRPITPATFFRDGRPLWLMTPYAHIQAGIDAQKAADPSFHCGAMTWKAVTEKFLGEPVEYEFMRSMPMHVPRALHVAAAEFCKLKHGVSLTEYILSQPNKEFSEFNSLGALAYSRARDDFYWLDTTKEPLPESVAIQKWSHEVFSDATKAEFEAILKLGLDPILSGHGEPPADAENVDPLPAQIFSKSESTAVHALAEFRNSRSELTNSDLEKAASAMIPWFSKEQSVAEIRILAERLQKFCTTSPRTRRVREELHKLGVIELPYRFKRRGKWRKRKATK